MALPGDKSTCSVLIVFFCNKYVIKSSTADKIDWNNCLKNTVISTEKIGLSFHLHGNQQSAKSDFGCRPINQPESLILCVGQIKTKSLIMNSGPKPAALF